MELPSVYALEDVDGAPQVKIRF